MQKAVVLILISILFLPILMCAVSGITKINMEINLDGYTDTANKPEFSIGSFLSSAFQQDYTAWLDQNLICRGYLIKTYKTIRYRMFNMCEDYILGENKDIFIPHYIWNELCIEYAKNYRIEQNEHEMIDYVNKINALNTKLKDMGKYLFIYIAPSKGYCDYNNIPKKYTDFAPEERLNALECFAQKISQTDVPALVCRDYVDQLLYPPFYPTGIHWSRTYEQEMHVRIINELKKLTGKNYRNIILGNVNESERPFWRDADVYANLNVWDPIKGIEYYEYTTSEETPIQYDKLKVLLQGDSFGEGFRHDIMELYPSEDIYFISRGDWYVEKQMPLHSFTSINNFSEIDFDRILNDIDIVIIEATEAELMNYSFGFIDFMIDYLDEYCMM